MSARVTLILINEEYQIMTGDIVYKDLIQLDLDVRNTDELFEVMAGRLMELGYVTGDFLESTKEREGISHGPSHRAICSGYTPYRPGMH